MQEQNKQLTRAQIAKYFPEHGQKACQFVLGAHNPSQFPDTHYPEVAFIGASNVGKSSLINFLTSQKIAIVSNTPGRTRQVNFFLLAEKLMLVDMPGYGFAKAKDKHIQQWQKTSFEYFAKRRQLKRVFFLVDPTKGLKETDFEMANIFNSLGLSFQIVLTKIDKLKIEQIKAAQEKILEQTQLWAALYPTMISCSVKNKTGLVELKKEIINAVS